MNRKEYVLSKEALLYHFKSLLENVEEETIFHINVNTLSNIIVGHRKNKFKPECDENIIEIMEMFKNVFLEKKYRKVYENLPESSISNEGFILAKNYDGIKLYVNFFGYDIGNYDNTCLREGYSRCEANELYNMMSSIYSHEKQIPIVFPTCTIGYMYEALTDNIYVIRDGTIVDENIFERERVQLSIWTECSMYVQKS